MPGGNLQFSYSMQGGKLITMVFAAHLDGAEVDVKDGTGQKIGSVQACPCWGEHAASLSFTTSAR
jgi:hypothetical protein